MATPYNKIRLKFAEKITDYDFSKYLDQDKDKIIDGYMISSCAQFSKCKIDLSDRDNIFEQFNNDLTDEIIEIIVAGMIVEWLKPKVLHSDNLANYLNTKDLSLAASPANILKEVKGTLNECRNEFKRLIIQYTYDHSDVSELTS